MKQLLGYLLIVALSTAGGPVLQAGPEQASPRASAAQEERRESVQRTAETFAALKLHPGSVVADIGAGSGFHTVRLARRVGPAGRVLAVDVDPNALAMLRARVEEEGLANVEVIHGAADDPRLGTATLDAALIVNAYHEMPAYDAILSHVRRALKPEGRLVIVEPLSASRRDLSRDAQVRSHEIAPSFVVAEARASGFALLDLQDPFAEGHGAQFWMGVFAPAGASAATRQRDQVGALASSAVERITTGQLSDLMATGPVVLLDVRDDALYARGRIPGARLATMSALRDVVAAVRGTDVPIVAYCSCPQEESSGRAVLYLEKHGVTGGRALLGGYDAWVSEGRPVESPTGR